MAATNGLYNKITNTNLDVSNVINPHVYLQEESSKLMAYPDTFRRFFGETEMNAEPMVTGFGIVFFTQLPKELNKPENANYLTAMTTSFDLPDMTMNSIDYEGRNGGQWHVPGSTTIGNDLTFGFWEMRGIPVYRMIARWIHIMRNPHYGFMTDVNWRQAEYKGKMLYAICTPDLEVQMAQVYSGIWPTDLRTSAFKYDNNQEKVEYSVSFKFDHYPYTSDNINAAAKNLVRMSVSNLNTILERKYTNAGEPGEFNGRSTYLNQ